MDKKLLLALVVVAALAITLTQTGSIIPSAGIGGLPIYAPGETVHWRVALNSQDGVPLFAALGCGNAVSYTPVTVIGQTTLICNGNTMGGINLQSPQMSCNVFQGTNAAITFNGEASATIPTTATDCYISNLFTAYKNSAPDVMKQRDDSTNTGTLVIQVLPVCTTGQRMCSGSQPKVCTNNQWQQSEVCANGCSAGYCTRVCTTGAKQCYGSLTQVCNAAGEWVFDFTSTSCVNPPPPPNATKICPTGEVVPVASVCPLYCGDALCNNGETSATCLRDCPIVPPPQNNSTNTCPVYAPCPSGQHGVSLGLDANGCQRMGCENDITPSACLPLIQKGTTAPCETDWMVVGIVAAIVLVGTGIIGGKRFFK